MKKFYKKLIISVMFFIGLAIGVEISLRIFLELGNPPLMVKDEEIGYLFKANQNVKRFGNKIIYNKYHQRSEGLMEKPDYRVLMLGDSVTNSGVLKDHSELITEMLEKDLNEHYKVKGEVLNVSAGSWGIENELEYLKRFGAFNSDLVILQIGTHDLIQPKSNSSVIDVMPNQISRKPATAVTDLLNRHVIPAIKDYFFKEEKKDNDEEGKRQKDFEKNMEALKDEIKFIKNLNMPVIVLFTPNRIELEEESQKNEKVKFREILKDENVELIETLKSMEKDDFIDLVHLSVKGNKLMEKLLFSYIVKSKVLENKIK